MLLPVALTQAEVDACGEDASAACLFVFRRTDSELLGRVVDWLVARPLKIVLIVALAYVVNRIVQRAIARMVTGVDRAALRTVPGEASTPGSSLMLTGRLGERARQRAQTLGALLRSLAKAVIVSVAGLMVLAELDLNLGPLIAGAGIVGIALGFGAQTLVRDFLSGVFMLVEDQLGVGDLVDVGPASGVVEGVSLRTTRIRDVQGAVWHVPNGEIKRVANLSQDWARAVLEVQVAPDVDPDRAEQVIGEAVEAIRTDDRWAGVILDDPEVRGVERLDASGAAIRLVLRTRPADQYGVLRALRREIAAGFDRAGLAVPVVLPTAVLPGNA